MIPRDEREPFRHFSERCSAKSGKPVIFMRRTKRAGSSAWRCGFLLVVHSPRPSSAQRNHALVKSLFGCRAEAMYRGFANTARLHPKQPHWYLFFIGIHPTFQGRGIGRRLLEPVLRRADRERVLCYLETPFATTHEFYRRLGFRLRPGTFPFEGAPTLWTMVRKPVGAAS